GWWATSASPRTSRRTRCSPPSNRGPSRASRTRARAGPSGEPVPIHEQKRGLWDPLLIHRGYTALLRAKAIGEPPGPYVLQAAIAACHAQAPTAEDTDWEQIASLYGVLAKAAPSPVVELNRAVAVGMAYGPERGLATGDALAAVLRLRGSHKLPVVRGDLLARAGRRGVARAQLARAAELTRNGPERRVVLVRA